MSMIFKFIARSLKMVCGDHFPQLVDSINHFSVFDCHNIKFYAPSKLCLWRGQTLLTKEPGTIEWINGFGKNDIFWDIGANVGIYSLYAALKKDIGVYSFEPSPFNFHVLAKNVYLNRLSSKIHAFCLAFSDQTTIDFLNMKSISDGAAHTSFKGKTNEFGDSFLPQHSQATLGFRIDDFIKLFSLETPNHIKIDVDGAEALVIEGSEKTLHSSKLKSILIELTSDLKDKDRETFDKILSCGFILKRQDHPDGDLRLNNYIFYRE